MSEGTPISFYRIKEDPYTRVPNEVLENPNLSWKAKALLAYIMGRPPNWIIMTGDLVKRSTDGREAVRAGMIELQAAGYARLEDSKKGKRWVVCDVPQKPKTENQHEPKTEKPSVAFPDVAFTSLNKNKGNNTEESNVASVDAPAPSEQTLYALPKPQRRHQPPFIPPSKDECRAYAVEMGLPAVEGSSFFYHHDARDWMMANGKRMKKWKSAMGTWKINHKKYEARHNAGYQPRYTEDQAITAG